MKISLDAYMSFIESNDKSDFTVDFINQILHSHGFKKFYKTPKKVLVAAVESVKLMNPSRITLRQNISSGPFISHDEANLDVKSLEWFECSNCSVTTVHTHNVHNEALGSMDLVLYEGKEDKPNQPNQKSVGKRPCKLSSITKKNKRSISKRPDAQYQLIVEGNSMQRQKLDFSRPVLPERLSGQISSIPEGGNSMPAEDHRTILFAWENNSEWPKHGKRPVNHDSENISAPTRPSQEGYIISEGLNSDDEEDEQIDEWDNISSNVSFLENFKISGWSMGESDADTQAKDFIMWRFLHSAKAIASEKPPYSSKNMNVISTEQKRATVRVNAARFSPAPQGRTNCSKSDVAEEEEYIPEEDKSNISRQRCRLLPKSCILSLFRGHKMFSKTRSKSVCRESVKNPRTPSTVRRDTKNNGQFNDKPKTVSSGSSLSQEIKSSSTAEKEKYLKTEIMTAPQLPLPPSDSWLHRALPSLTSENHFMRSPHGSTKQKHYFKKKTLEQKRVELKWETKVKKSNIHRGNLPYNSQEMLAPISEIEALDIST